MPRCLILLLLFSIAILWWIRLGLPPMQHDPLSRSPPDVLFFFRIPKTGSEMIALLLQWLQGTNNFRHIRLRSTVNHRLDPRQRIELFEEMTSVLEMNGDSRLPVSFDRHVHFIDFGAHPQFSKVRLHYFSSIRDPIDRMVSQFYYARVTPPTNVRAPNLTAQAGYHYKSFEECVEAEDPECVYITGRNYDMMIPYFCGHRPFCSELNNIDALNLAKKNVEMFFPVVGVLEQINCTLHVSERLLRPFFQNVEEMYYNILLEPKKNKNYDNPRAIRDDLAAILRRNLTIEYEFYHYIQKRLLSQCGVSEEAENDI